MTDEGILLNKSDSHVDVHNKENNKLDATIGSLLKIPMLARHVSGNSYAHLQEH